MGRNLRYQVIHTKIKVNTLDPDPAKNKKNKKNRCAHTVRKHMVVQGGRHVSIYRMRNRTHQKTKEEKKGYGDV